MDSLTCSICGYSLTSLAEELACPECGSPPKVRYAASYSQSALRRLTVWSILLVIPSAGFWLVTVAGWLIAHLVIGIANPGGVQDGVFPSLDVLGGVTSLLLLPSLLCSIAALPLLAYTVAWIAKRGRKANRHRLVLIVAMLSIPIAVHTLAFIRPNGTPLAIFDWIPD